MDDCISNNGLDVSVDIEYPQKKTRASLSKEGTMDVSISTGLVDPGPLMWIASLSVRVMAKSE